MLTCSGLAMMSRILKILCNKFPGTQFYSETVQSVLSLLACLLQCSVRACFLSVNKVRRLPFGLWGTIQEQAVPRKCKKWLACYGAPVHSSLAFSFKCELFRWWKRTSSAFHIVQCFDSHGLGTVMFFFFFFILSTSFICSVGFICTWKTCFVRKKWGMLAVGV